MTQNRNSKCSNVQILPTDNFKIAVDVLTRKVFEMCIDGEGNANLELNESHIKKLVSKITVTNFRTLQAEFTEFDWAVFDATLSARTAGNEYATAAIIYRQLGGGHVVTAEMRRAIIDSLDKLAAIRIVADLTATEKIYDSPIGDFHFRGYLLPTESLEMTVNGQPADVIHFLSRGPAFTIADMKNQILTCPRELLASPVRATPRSIAINHYLLRWILEMKGSSEAAKSNKRVKPLRHTILFDSLYKSCGLKNAGYRQKQQARETATAILNYFVEKELIKKYEFETGSSGKIRAITIGF